MVGYILTKKRKKKNVPSALSDVFPLEIVAL